METTLNRASHAVYNIQLHIVLVTKYHKDVINQAILGKLQEVLDRVCSKRKSKLLEFSGEENHVHLLVDLHPDNNISQFVSSLKSASSRIIRSEFQEYLKQFYWKKEDPSFWTDAYCVISVGGASLETVKQYVQNQKQPNRAC